MADIVGAKMKEDEGAYRGDKSVITDHKRWDKSKQLRIRGNSFRPIPS